MAAADAGLAADDQQALVDGPAWRLGQPRSATARDSARLSRAQTALGGGADIRLDWAKPPHEPRLRASHPDQRDAALCCDGARDAPAAGEQTEKNCLTASEVIPVLRAGG